MRKELGKPTRDLFFRRIKEIAPEFLRVSTYDIKGFTWSFLRREGNLRQWLTFQRHKYEDAFTVGLSWSCLDDNPTLPRWGSPADPPVPGGCQFRLGHFWDPKHDKWWHIVKPEDDAFGMMFPLGDSQMAAALVEVPRQVEDAITGIEQHALPYFEMVARWARRRSPRVTAASNKPLKRTVGRRRPPAA